MATAVVVPNPEASQITPATEAAITLAVADAIEENEEDEVRSWLRSELEPLLLEMRGMRETQDGLLRRLPALLELNSPEMLQQREETILRLLSRLEDSLTPKVLEIVPAIPATPAAEVVNAEAANPAAETSQVVVAQKRHRGI